ncbi:FAD-dependent oxidoreductase [Nonomuraea sp. NPDC059194]|uniref:FAD-dependent oxidoreductase n=1 Tax=Nonomuraea sp. NPDC059194 TaxID=3346764 RepID=UPI0036A203A8
MRCVIAGGGPAGAMLALLLARAGVEVTLLEKHADFLRDFRGDTIHPSTLQVLDELGLAEEFHRIPHRKAYRLDLVTDTGTSRLADLRGLPGRYDYIAFVPQWDFLTLLTSQAAKYPSFRLLMNAEAYGLIRDGGTVRGLRYRDGDGEHELRADLTVAADGRGSVLRAAAGLTPTEFGVPMDVVWFRLPREDTDPGETFLRLSPGRLLVTINRESYWQLGFVVAKGDAELLRAAGVEELRGQVGRLLPFLEERVTQLRSFEDVSTLTVALNRLRRWYRPGFLCIGDAAHAMTPVFGVGINLAVQDAVATANIILREGPSAVRKVQRRRMFPTRVTQFAQRVAQRQLIKPVLAGSPRMSRVPDLARMPVINRLARTFIGKGVRPEHVAMR